MNEGQREITGRWNEAKRKSDQEVLRFEFEENELSEGTYHLTLSISARSVRDSLPYP